MRQRLSKTKTWIAITLVLLGAVLVFAVRKERASAGEFFTAPVDMGSLRTSVNATGAVQTVVTVQVGSQISGQILELYADYNSMVKRGQLLAKIDPRNFQAQVENAQASVAAAQARMIMPGNTFFGGASLGAGAASTLTEEDVQAMVREIQPGQTDDFLVRSLTDVAQASAQVTTLMTVLLGSIAAISLIVGGVGIMNIMLVSVTERTREIGIRMAVGARPNTIRLQFLTESLVLSLAGGAVGVVIGGTLAALVSRVLGWPTLVSALSVLISFAFATAIGIFFGYYPAHKAAALDPIDALRYE
ncbi:MAG: hypothetical protein AUG08_11760 [Acidobacteria bacterium 13_1_20CM_2_55_15]|nr:MAG: hypothetical protein AUI45_13110 [Acidobacteria bacterium 13_1_40CM_2_56_11]OLE87509.1 MAG: hypothetical protein AUG08_11760 [Acidobacteria bacterium 13_1_20CM_2_55_15]